MDKQKDMFYVKSADPLETGRYQVEANSLSEVKRFCILESLKNVKIYGKYKYRVGYKKGEVSKKIGNEYVLSERRSTSKYKSWWKDTIK